MSDSPLADEQYCYLTTTGRSSGKPREIEIWFALIGSTAYLLAGGGERANWVQNLRREPAALLRIGARELKVRAREPAPGAEGARARAALFDKYSSAGSDLSRWRDHGLLVALDID